MRVAERVGDLAEVGRGDAPGERRGDGLVEQERGEAEVDLLGDWLEAGLGEEVAEATGRGVVDGPFDPGDADVVDEPAPGPVAVAVDQHQATARLEDPAHLLDGPVLVRVVVEAVGAGDDVERPPAERAAARCRPGSGRRRRRAASSARPPWSASRGPGRSPRPGRWARPRESSRRRRRSRSRRRGPGSAGRRTPP